MRKEINADVAVIGGGIVGLAIAYQEAKNGNSVVVFERNEKAIGASVRNFGLIWPIGQAPEVYNRALRSREIWNEVATEAKLWHNSSGSMHLVYHEDEKNVIEEFHELAKKKYSYQCEVISAADAGKKSNAININGLKGALWSNTEMTIDPREALEKIPLYLQEKYNITFRFGTLVRGISLPFIETTTESWKVQKAYVCSGSDFETLFPEELSRTGITKCKLQMLRTVPQKDSFTIGPALCGGLTLTFYAAFKICSTLEELKKRLNLENKNFYKYGIHVLLSQHGTGELTIGDSHEYGLCPAPFDNEEIDATILTYLKTFARIPQLEIAYRWQGIYPKLEGKTELILEPEKNVIIVNGLGGAGMTFSFGLAEELVNKI